MKSSPTPASLLISGDHGPAALTTISAEIISPLASSTPITRAPSWSTLATELLNRKVAPLLFDAAAKFSAASCGSSTYPPLGVKMAPSSDLAALKNSSLCTGFGGQYFPVSKYGALPFNSSALQTSNGTPACLKRLAVPSVEITGASSIMTPTSCSFV